MCVVAAVFCLKISKATATTHTSCPTDAPTILNIICHVSKIDCAWWGGSKGRRHKGGKRSSLSSSSSPTSSTRCQGVSVCFCVCVGESVCLCGGLGEKERERGRELCVRERDTVGVCMCV